MRILLIRTSALGDVVHCLPVLAALRRAHPNARLGWVVEEAMAPLLEGLPELDELFVVRLRRWRKRPLAPSTVREVGEFLRRLRGFDADVALDLMGNHKAGSLAALSFAERRIGAPRSSRREPSSTIWIDERVEPSGVHAVDRALSLAARLGASPERPDFLPERLLSVAPRATLDWLSGRRAPYLLVHPGAAWANKRYPPERWGAVAKIVRSELDLETVVAVAPGEEDLSAALVESAAGSVAPVAAPSLAAFAALARRAALVAGGDTGPLHLAHALAAPVLMILGPTDPARHGPYAAPQRALARRLPCSYCYQRFTEVKACLSDIPPHEIATRVRALLA